MFKRIVVSIYLHPDFFPPTINAINNLAKECEELIVITRNNSLDDYSSSSNVKFIKNKEFALPYELEKTSMTKKIVSFLNFTRNFFKYAVSSKTDLVVLYDPIPLFSYFVINKFIKKKTKVWYHNHDMPNINTQKKFSIGWFAAKYEYKAMEKINIFSLPNSDRLVYYPNINKEIQYFFIPNYPSKILYTKDITTKLPQDNTIKILFQGAIGEGHSLEELTMMLNEKIANKTLSLTLKGPKREAYKQKIDAIAVAHNTIDKLEWIGISTYREVKDVTKECQIGIAIFMGKDEVSKTLGSASNKIYEYAACGLPVIAYDNEQFRKHIGQYKWVTFTDGTISSLQNAIEHIIANFDSLSIAARNDFENIFYFEKAFENAIKELKN